MRAWWQGLQPRERALIGFGAAAIALALAWAFVWQPLARGREGLRQQVAQAEAQLAWMHGAVAEYQRLRAAGGLATSDRGGRSLLALADGSAREAGLGGALTRVEPVDAARVTVWFTGVGFDALAAWLEDLARRYGIAVDELAVDRGEGVGQVDARITLVDPPR